MGRRSDIVEGVAIVAAIACLAHCIGLPLLFALLPAFASVLPVPESFHVMALLLAVPATAGALFIGYRQHRLAAPLLAGTLGLTLLMLGALRWGGSALEVPTTILGSIAIAAAHLTNWRLRRAHHLLG